MTNLLSPTEVLSEDHNCMYCQTHTGGAVEYTVLTICKTVLDAGCLTKLKVVHELMDPVLLYFNFCSELMLCYKELGLE